MRIPLLAAAAALATTLPAAPAAAAETISTRSSAEVRLPHISITAIGEGSPVVLIPGLSSPRATWD